LEHRGRHQRLHHPLAVQQRQALAAGVQRLGAPEGAHGALDVAAGAMQHPGLPEDDDPGAIDMRAAALPRPGDASLPDQI
jgi:hypothetical protein